ncbi:MAG: hypothetical protein AUJ56_03430 [Zetaproteobacteria bacterium CG1_02_49_23]|nr:MAG: hypothetical protein AUJ56_03430 [Zetaproteobacteria bacterium CG1_02_49_23]
MKKIIIIAIVLAISLISPALVGNMAHSAYQRGIENAPVTANSMNLTQKDYAQSWFTSTALTELRLNTGDAELDAIKLVLNSQIQHGPLLLTDDGIKFGMAYIHTNINVTGLPAKAQRFFNKHLPADAISDTTLIDFQQLAHDRLSIAAFQLDDEKMHISVGSIEAHATSALDYSTLRGDYTLLASALSNDDINISLTDTSGKFDYHLSSEDMLIGKSSLSLPLILAVTKQGKISLEQLSFSTDGEEQNGKLNMSEHISIEKITAPIPLTAFTYDIQLNQLNPAALKAWAEITREAQAASAQDKALDAEKLGELFTLLFQEGLELNQQIKLDGMGGTLSIDCDARYVEPANGVQLKDLIGDKTILQAADIHLLAELDRSVVDHPPFDSVVASLLEQGTIAEKGDKLSVEIKLKQSALTVNEKPLPIEILYPWLGLNQEVRDNYSQNLP